MNVYRCRICQEGYLGDKPPTHCPFCGAHQQYIVEAAGFYIPKYTLGEISRHNLDRALEFEIHNAEFYFCAADQADNVHDATMFNRLAMIESEHAEVIMRELNIPSIDIRRDIKCYDENINNLAESYKLESHAIHYYSQYVIMATEERIREIFSAIIEIEYDHLGLTDGRF